MSADNYTRVTELDTLRTDGREVVSAGGKSVVLFHHEGEVYAVDNRCPHMGFPLSEGTVDDGILTCHWHHARFELACGDTFDIFADDVQTYPTEICDGEVWLDPDPEPDVPPETYWRNRLIDGMSENLSLVMAKAVINLDDLGEGFETPLETAVEFGINYRADGWGRGLTTLGTMANLYEWVDHPEKRRAMYVGTQEVAANCAGEPPRFEQYALDNERLDKERLKEWFRDNCEVRDEDGAERTIRTAAAVLPPEQIVEVLVAAATDHLYLNGSHTLDFINKACETLDHIGWGRAPEVFGAIVPQLTGARRAEEQQAWRKPIDVAEFVFDAHDALSELVAAGEDRNWDRPDDFVDRLLDDDPEAIIDALRTAIREGATAEQLTDAVADAATRRVAQFATSNEFSDWDTVHHTFSYANAAHELAHRTDAIETYRPAFDGAMAVYLDRFLNQPAAPLPDPDGTDRTPEQLRTALLETFDEQGRVNDAGRLVAEHFAADGDPEALIATLGEGLLREDPQFHTLQNLEAAVRRYDRATTAAGQELALVATARYMAAHYPTRREGEQTFDIARRLHRGESLHEES
ncbi:Rieske (2Fe-2S) protein [Halobacteriaceae archaeon SHR40]|uniref:Rieske (2Fe-2S) protein n=1 Tax=Halovenus amylolytica TaxID=2500550 RepID=UPI000FE43851